MVPIGIGERLRSARQALGLSLEEIESVTHIRRSYLEALEQEAFEALPSPAYIRGFLRAYAGCLGIPPEDLLDRYPAITVGEVSHRGSPVEVRITPAVRMSPARRAVMGVGLLVGLGVLFVGFVLYTQVREFALTAPQGTSPDRGAPPRSPTAPSATATQPPRFPSAAPGGGAPASPPQAAPPPAGSPGPGAPSTSPPSTPSPSPAQPPGPASPAPSPGAPARPAAPGPGATPPTTPSAQPPQPAAPLNVTVASTGHTWVRTVADGATVFEGFLNAGDKQIWQAKRTLTLRVGNAAVVDVAVNGKPLGPLGGSGVVYEHTFSAGAPAP